MTMSSHLQQLRNKHQNLSELVEKAEKSVSTDRLEVQKLKKQKLVLKEEIERLSHA